MTNHPITPPPELVRQWAATNGTHYEDLATLLQSVANQATRWGADQELEACIDLILAQPGLKHPELLVEVLRAARRPKPPSLAAKALDATEDMSDCMNDGFVPNRSSLDIIRAALERLQQLEQQENND